MTLLVAWSGVDTHGTASAYIAADSRISWTGNTTFDHGRKVYGLDHFPDIFGYCGDVLFPTLVLGQIAEMADNGLLFARNASPRIKSEAVALKLAEQFNKYPSDVANMTINNSIQILHISRSFSKPIEFKGYLNQWKRGQGWSKCELEMPEKSELLSVLGSGQPAFTDRFSKYRAGPSEGTSRAVFHCFCQTVASGTAIGTGGAPQLVGLYRSLGSKARKYGIIVNSQRFLFGASIEETTSPDKIEWRNDLFEICDGRTKLRLINAQPQPDPITD